MIVGLDKLTRGKPCYTLFNAQEHYTGYFQLDHGRYYWQLNSERGTRWLRLDREPSIINYSKQIEVV